MSRESARAVIAQALSQGRTNLTADEAGEICRAYGLPLPAERVATDAATAADAAREVGYPVALKVLSSQITHKSDAGAIALGRGIPASKRDIVLGSSLDFTETLFADHSKWIARARIRFCFPLTSNSTGSSQRTPRDSRCPGVRASYVVSPTRISTC